MSTKIISTNILATIVAHKLKEVAARKNEITISQLEAMPLFSKKAISLKANLSEWRREFLHGYWAIHRMGHNRCAST